MASTNQRQTIDRRVNTLVGHYVKWEISKCSLSLFRSWHFVKNYRTFCETKPTSWLFKMWFPEVREDGTASLTVSLTRVDAINVDLEAEVELEICDHKRKLIYEKNNFTKSKITPGAEIEDTVELTPLPGMKAAICRNVVIQVSLLITSCHSCE